MRIEIFPGGKGQYFWHLRSANGNIVAQGEAHNSRGNAIRAAKGVVRGVFGQLPVEFKQSTVDGVLTYRWW